MGARRRLDTDINVRLTIGGPNTNAIYVNYINNKFNIIAFESFNKYTFLLQLFAQIEERN